MLIKLRKDKKGFTLVELIVVIAILGVLAMLIVPRIVGNVSDAKNKKEIANARTLASEITIHNASHEDKTKWVKPATPGAALKKTEYENATTGLTLPTGIDWPLNTVVEIYVDDKGDASIKVLP